MPKPSHPTEEAECRAFAAWLTIMGLTFSHVPNETYTASWSVKTRNRMMGVRRGVPDYLLIVPAGDGSNRLAFVEMKRKGTPKSALKPEQAHWITELNKIPGVSAAVCRGFDEAESLITRIWKT